MTDRLLQAADKLQRELPAGTAPPLDVPPTRRIYGGPVAAVDAADADKEFCSSAAAAVAMNVRITRGCDLARQLADAEERSELEVNAASATRDDIHDDGTVIERRWVRQSYQVMDAAGTPTVSADPASGRSAGRSVGL